MTGEPLTNRLQPSEPWDSCTGYHMAELYFGETNVGKRPFPCNPETFGLRTNDAHGVMLYRTTWTQFYVSGCPVPCLEMDLFLLGNRSVKFVADWNLPYERLVARKANLSNSR